MVNARYDERITWFQNLICGGTAVMLSRSVTSPLEVVKVLAQVGTQETKQGLTRTFGNIYRNEGLKAFWKGNWMTCVRLFPYSALQLIAFNYLVVSAYMHAL
jgi:solute carrier family 25 protein 43